MRIELQKKEKIEEKTDEFKAKLEKANENINKFLAKKRKRVEEEILLDANIEIENIQEDSERKVKRVIEDMNIKLARMEKEIKIEKERLIARFKEEAQEKILLSSFKEIIGEKAWKKFENTLFIQNGLIKKERLKCSNSNLTRNPSKVRFFRLLRSAFIMRQLTG